MIFLDFETRSECGIKKCGAWVYAQHPSTEILCLAYTFHDDKGIQLWTPKQPAPTILLNTIAMGAELEAHSAFFERSIWENICVKKMGWPPIHPDQWRCSAARVAARALPRSLAGASAALNLAVKKDLTGRALMLKMSKPRKTTIGDPSPWHEDIMDLYRLYEYCKTDVATEREVSKTVKELSRTELAVWQLDQKINMRGVLVDKAGCDAAIKVMGELTTRLRQEFVELTKGKIKTTGQRDKLLAWLSDEGTEMDGLTKNEVTATLGGEMSGVARRALEIRQQLSKTSTIKFQRMLDASGSDGRIRDMLLYHGAATGRWTGRLVQLQNIPRGTVEITEESIKLLKTADLDKIETFFPDVAGFVSSCIRGMLVAARGCELFAADYSAIEARVLFWLADEMRGLDLYHQKADLYVRMAKTIYPQQEIDKTKRTVGKTTILGCGYSMGFKKFKDTLKIQTGLEITEDFSRYVVDTYRRTFPMVPKMWYATEAAAIQAVKKPNVIVQNGKVNWGYNTKADVLYCQLPSGRLLSYNSPRIKASAKFEGKLELSCMVVAQGVWVRESTYGGKLVENITQATARDIMAHAMLELERQGFPLVLSVHDEIVAEVPVTDKRTVEEFVRIMTDLPGWAKGCPVEAEGWKGPRYKK